jgi:outer membrane receptor protein involved in Fe transport
VIGSLLLRRTCCVVTALALLLGSAASFAQTPAPAPDAGVVRGRVIDAVTRDPLGGTSVSLVWPPAPGEAAPREETRVAGPNGEFEFAGVPAGTYSVRFRKPGFRDSTMTDLAVVAGQESRADFPLPPFPVATSEPKPGVEEFVVIASPLEEILEASRMESDQLLNTLGAEEISKFAASDVADALRFVPGVNVVKGQFAIIRGLEDRYSSTLYNSAPVPSPDPDRQSVQLDLFPSDIVSDLVVAKTFAADLPSNSSGGSINILSHGYPEETSLKFSAGSGFNDRALDRFLEFQDDSPIGKEAENSDVIEHEFGLSLAGRRDFGPRELRFKALLNREVDFDTADGFQEGLEPRAAVARSFPLPARIVEPGGGSLGELGLSAGRYDLTESERAEQSTSYLGLGFDLDGEGAHRIDLSGYYTRKGDELVQLRENGYLPGCDYGPLRDATEQGQTVSDSEFDGCATLDASVRNIRGSSEGDPTEGPAWFSSFLTGSSFDTDRDLLVYQLNGDHRPAGIEGLHLGWAGNYARTNQDDEAWGSRIFYEPTDVADPASIPEQLPATPENLGDGTYYVSADTFQNENDILEDARFGRLDLEYERELSEAVVLTLSTGGWLERADRDVGSSFLETPGVGSPSSPVWALPGETLLEAGQAISPALTLRDDGTFAGSRQTTNESRREIDAFGFGAKATVFEDFDLIAGMRREQILIESNNDPFTGEVALDGSPKIFPSKYVFLDRQDNPARNEVPGPPGTRFNDEILNVQLPVDPVTGFVDLVDREDIEALVNGKIDERRVLPAYGIAYRPLEGLSLRGAFSRTVARPSFREMGYYVSVEPATDDLVVGNPQLQLSDVESWDFRAEYVWGDHGDLAALSLFAKQIEKPIESITVRDAGVFDAASSALYRTYFNNPNEARLRGLELEARKSLDFFGVELLEYFSLGGNFTWIDAEVERTDAELERSERFFGVPEGTPAGFGRMDDTRRLFGQPEYIANADISFHHPDWGTRITLAYFQISDILDAAGTANINPDGRVASFTLDRYIDSYHRLDLVLSQKRRVEMLGGDLVFKVSLKNLTDSKRQIIYDPEQTAHEIVERSLRVGREFSFSVGYDVPF